MTGPYAVTAEGTSLQCTEAYLFRGTLETNLFYRCEI
jgi:hypothetical protein